MSEDRNLRSHQMRVGAIASVPSAGKEGVIHKVDRNSEQIWLEYGDGPYPFDKVVVLLSWDRNGWYNPPAVRMVRSS